MLNENQLIALFWFHLTCFVFLSGYLLLTCRSYNIALLFHCYNKVKDCFNSRRPVLSTILAKIGIDTF